MSTEDYNQKLQALNSRPMRVKLRHKKDIKFRKDCENFENFYVHSELLTKVLDNHMPLKAWLLNVFNRLNLLRIYSIHVLSQQKEFIFGADYTDFQFDKLWLQEELKITLSWRSF